MQELRLTNKANHIQSRRFTEVRPRIYRDGDSVTLQDRRDPERDARERSEFPGALLHPNDDGLPAPSPGTRTHRDDRAGRRFDAEVVLSPASYDTHHSDRNQPIVIALREQFCIPEDDDRFRVIIPPPHLFGTTRVPFV
jgi:hypothetical protein